MVHQRGWHGLSRYRRRQIAVATVLSGLLLALSWASATAGVDHIATPGATPVNGASTLSPEWRASYSGPPCGVLAAEYGNLTGINDSANYSIIFAKICQTSQFVSLYYEGMNASGIFVIGAGGPIGEPVSLAFSLYRTDSCTNASLGTQCVFQADWVGYLSNNSFSGPYLREYPLIYMGGPVLAPGSSSSGLNPWFTAILGIAIAASVAVVAVTARSQSALRAAVLSNTAEPVTSPQQNRMTEATPSESNDTLDDIF